LAFRYSVIDRLPETPSPATVKGSLVHRALERLYWFHDPGDRSQSVAMTELDIAWEEFQSDEEFVALELTAEEQSAFLDDAAVLVARYFELENPDETRTIGVEILLEAEVDGMLLRGIIDRLDLDEDGELVIVDYKTGKVPSETREHGRLGAVHTYAMLCERVLGKRPVRVRLLYLRDRIAIEAAPSAQSVRGTGIRTNAVWAAICRACESEDFRPSPSPLCGSCSFRHLCPAMGGEPSVPAGLVATPS
jgi:putative RecB family exonuclease